MPAQRFFKELFPVEIVIGRRLCTAEFFMDLLDDPAFVGGRNSSAFFTVEIR